MGRMVALSALALLCSHAVQVAAIPSFIPPANSLKQVLLGNSGSGSDGNSLSAVFSPVGGEGGDGDSDVVSIPQTAADRNAQTMRPPSWFTSTLMARRLLALSTIGSVSSIFPDHPATGHTPDAVAGLSITLPEYIADCDGSLPTGNADGEDEDEGNPTLLALRVSTTFRNTAAGSNISLALDWWDHLDQTQPVAPGFPRSEAGLPRITLIGYVEPFATPVPDDTQAALEACYLAAHPDAAVWLPGKPGSPHASYWARMVVTQAYWIGGFGGFQQIGWVNVTEWKGIRRQRSLPGIGDGRGWEDVRLPGEKE